MNLIQGHIILQSSRRKLYSGEVTQPLGYTENVCLGIINLIDFKIRRLNPLILSNWGIYLDIAVAITKVYQPKNGGHM
jgi:hypothetical protein